jgi:DNA-binding NtrC family response regulator
MRWTRAPASPRPRRSDSAEEGAQDALPQLPATMTLAEIERLLIRDRLARSPTKAAAARSLGIGARTLYTKLRAMKGVERQSGRGSARG